MKARIAIPVLAAVLGAGGYFAYRHFTPDTEAMTLYGNVDIREAVLAFRVSGRVADIKVDEGDMVKAGDVLAVLDSEPLEIAARAADAAVSSISAHNALIHSGSRAEDIAHAKAKVEAAEVAFVHARQQHERLKALMASGIVSQDSLDTAEAARDQAEANLRAVEEQYKALGAGFRAEEKSESDALLRQAQANLDISLLAVRDATLLAPSDGIILTRAIEHGMMIQAGSPAFSLSLTNPVWVRAYVEGSQMGFFNSGTKVLLYTDSRPDKPYHGTVGFVSPTAEFTPKSVETAELRTSLVYRIRVVVDNPDEMLRQGMPVTIKRVE